MKRKVFYILSFFVFLFFIKINTSQATLGGSMDPCLYTKCVSPQICYKTTSVTAKCLNRIEKKCSSPTDCIVETGDLQTCKSGMCYVGDKSLATWNKTASGCDLTIKSVCYHNIGKTDTEKKCLDNKGLGLAIWPNATTKMCYLDDTAYKKYKETGGNVPKIYSEIKPPANRIGIPGLNFSSLTSTLDGEGYIYMPWIGQYISAVYKFALVAASLIAVLMIIVQGVTIMTGQGMATVDKWDDSGSGSKQTKQMAYQKITKILIGLAIAWGSYTILYMINPNLVEFKALKVKYIERDEFDYEEIFVDVPDNELSGTSIADIIGSKPTGGDCTKTMAKLSAEKLMNKGVCVGPCHCAWTASNFLQYIGCDSVFHANANNLAILLDQSGWTSELITDANRNKLEVGLLFIPGHVGVSVGDGGVFQSVGRIDAQNKKFGTSCIFNNKTTGTSCNFCAKIKGHEPWTHKYAAGHGGGSGCIANQAWWYDKNRVSKSWRFIIYPSTTKQTKVSCKYGTKTYQISKELCDCVQDLTKCKKGDIAGSH